MDSFCSNLSTTLLGMEAFAAYSPAPKLHLQKDLLIANLQFGVLVQIIEVDLSQSSHSLHHSPSLQEHEVDSGRPIEAETKDTSRKRDRGAERGGGHLPTICSPYTM